MGMSPDSMRKLLMQVFFQFGLLTILIIQCYSIAIVYHVFQAKQTLLLGAYLCTKKKKWSSRMKCLKIRRLCRKPRSAWIFNGRTDRWWENIVNGNVPDGIWKRNFRMSQSFHG